MDVNFKDEIIEAADGEPILAVVIHNNHNGPVIPSDKLGLILSWEEAKDLLDYEHDNGFGGQECHSIWVWTPHKIMFVHEYDGSTYIQALPRDPVPSN